jgi:spermidine synthase
LDSKQFLYSKDGVYQKITIYDGMYNGQKARFLFQDKNASAGEYFPSGDLAYEYTKYYSLYNIFTPNVSRALMIGGGAYSIPKALLQETSTTIIDVAEIEPSLFALAKEYFHFPESERVHNSVTDGRRFLHDSQYAYDFIFSDAYASFFSIPEHLTTQEFFTLAKKKLNNDGVFIANVIGSLSKASPSFLLSEIKTFKNVFDNSYFFAVVDPASQQPQNFIFVGYNSNKKINFNSLHIANHPNYIINQLPAKIINTESLDLSKKLLLVDNHAPVDYLISKEIRRIGN